jgi:hypothetical protein
MTGKTRLSFTPTAEIAAYAAEGLRLRKKFGRGGTMVGVARARDLKNRRPVSRKTILRMCSFFARHEVDKRGKNYGNPAKPSNGFIAWMLWGGDPGWQWAKDIREQTKDRG